MPQSGPYVAFVPSSQPEGAAGSCAGKPKAPPLSALPVVSRKTVSARQGRLT